MYAYLKNITTHFCHYVHCPIRAIVSTTAAVIFFRRRSLHPSFLTTLPSASSSSITILAYPFL